MIRLIGSNCFLILCLPLNFALMCAKAVWSWVFDLNTEKLVESNHTECKYYRRGRRPGRRSKKVMSSKRKQAKQTMSSNKKVKVSLPFSLSLTSVKKKMTDYFSKESFPNGDGRASPKKKAGDSPRKRQQVCSTSSNSSDGASGSSRDAMAQSSYLHVHVPGSSPAKKELSHQWQESRSIQRNSNDDQHNPRTESPRKKLDQERPEKHLPNKKQFQVERHESTRNDHRGHQACQEQSKPREASQGRSAEKLARIKLGHNEVSRHQDMSVTSVVKSKSNSKGAAEHQISDSDSDDTNTNRRPTKQAVPSPCRSQASPISPSTWSARDTEAYRHGYPGKRDNMSLNSNWKFYNNEMESKPRGDFIDDIHKHWYGDYSRLEEHHGYIQWLFPIREQGMNWQAQELQQHEAKRIVESSKVTRRVLMSYELMLYFWGMRLEDETTGHIVRGDNWKERFKHLNRSSHNYLRITRMLKSLGELGLERLKLPFLRFVLQEAILKQTLVNAKRSCLQYWIHTLIDDEERQDAMDFADELLQEVEPLS